MSRFVSGGTVEEPVQRDDAWLKAQQEIEAKRRQKEEQTQQNSGKSLYETLEANKAAKQEAFEEAIRLRNQFRALDDDEVEFLDSVLESTRAKEAAVKKETFEQLNQFRQQQESKERIDHGTDGDDHQVEQEDWSVGTKKRKRTKAGPAIAGVKLRKASSAAEPSIKLDVSEEAVKDSQGFDLERFDAEKSPGSGKNDKEKDKGKTSDTLPLNVTKPTVIQASPSATSALGLGGYSSDED